jgi:hypothetical protein
MRSPGRTAAAYVHAGHQNSRHSVVRTAAPAICRTIVCVDPVAVYCVATVQKLPHES